MTADLLSLATCSWPRAMTPSFTKRSSTGTAESVQVLLRTHTYTCHEETNKTLLQNFGIDVDKDQPNIHPKVFCLCCRHTATKATQYSECTASTLKVFQWIPHTELSCSCEVCCFFKEQKKGGTPKKERKNRGRPHSQHIVNRILLHATHI